MTRPANKPRRDRRGRFTRIGATQSETVMPQEYAASSGSAASQRAAPRMLALVAFAAVVLTGVVIVFGTPALLVFESTGSYAAAAETFAAMIVGPVGAAVILWSCLVLTGKSA